MLGLFGPRKTLTDAAIVIIEIRKPMFYLNLLPAFLTFHAMQ